MAFDVGAIVGRLELQKDQWNQSVKQVKADQKSLSGLVLRNSQQFKQMGRTMTIAGTAVVGAVGLMVKAHATFDKAMTESLAIMGDISEATRKEMAQTALDMSGKSTFAAKELAQAYFFLASAGMDAEQSIKALPVVTKFAQAGAFDLATATDLLTDAQTALGLSSKDAVENQKNLIEVSDVLVKANTLANASVQQFSEALTNRAAAALVNVNKEMYEGVAVLAAYADKGVKGNIAGTRLAMMLNALDVAAMKNKKAWKENGIALFDANEEMRSIGDLIGDLEVKLGTMTTKQKSATLAALGFNVRTKASILTLMGSSEKIKQWTEDLKDAGGTTEEVAKKQLQTLVNQFTILKNKITNAAISVGETLGPALSGIIEKLKGTVGQIAEWIKAHPKLTEVIAKSAVAFGGLLMVLGPLMIMLPGLIAVGPMIGVAFTAMLGPIGAVTVAILAFGAVANKVLDNYKKKQDAQMDAMVEAGKGARQFHAFRRKLIEDEIVTVEEWGEIYEKHGRSHKRVMVAMAKSPEYAYIREELDKLKEKKEEIEKSDDDLTDKIRENSEEVVKLTVDMVDEIMQATLGEFEYRIWAAKQTYEERKALLEAEKADKQAFFLVEKALAVELNEIEEDRIQKIKEGYAERGRAITAALEKWFADEKATREKIQGLHATYTDIIRQISMSEEDYKRLKLDEWFATELAGLEGNLVAKSLLEEAYALKKKELDKEIATNQIATFNEIFSTMASTISNFFSQIGGLSQTHFNNELAMLEEQDLAKREALTQEYEDKRKAIEDSLLSEEEKIIALLALDQEKQTATEKLEEETEGKKKVIQKKAFESEKKISLVTAAINIATAITMALRGGIPPWNAILAGITAAAGAVQLAAINAQAFPSAERGAYLPTPTLIEAGHGRLGEVILPLDKAPQAFKEMGGTTIEGARIDLNFYAPIISTTGLSNRDIDEAAEYFLQKMKREVARYGGKLNG